MKNWGGGGGGGGQTRGIMREVQIEKNRDQFQVHCG